MKKIRHYLEQIRWRILVYTCWFTVICKLLLTGQYLSFMRPEFAVILVLGAVSLLIFMLSACTGTVLHEPERKLLPVAIMLLPLFYYLNAQGVTLGGQAYSKRSTGMLTLNAAPAQTSTAGAVSASADPIGAAGTGEITPDTVAAYYAEEDQEVAVEEELTILDIYDFPQKYLGRRVKLSGMFHQEDAQITRDFGRKLPLIYRFVITCCAADALPVAMFLDIVDTAGLEEGSWVEVEGEFTTFTQNGKTVPVITEPVVRRIEPPAEPYLY